MTYKVDNFILNFFSKFYYIFLYYLAYLEHKLTASNAKENCAKKNKLKKPY